MGKLTSHPRMLAIHIVATKLKSKHRYFFVEPKTNITVHRQAILLLVVESRTRKLSGMPTVRTAKHLLLESTKSVEFGT